MADTAKKTFAGFDKFGLKGFADQLMRYLLVDRDFVEGSYVLSLNSEFGSGKTTFFEMWRSELEESDEGPEVIYLNAWESDFQGDALLAIVSRLLDVASDEVAKPEKQRVKETVGSVCKFGLSVGNDMVQKISGIDVSKAVQQAKGDGTKGKETSGRACFDIYQERQSLFEKLRMQLKGVADKVKRPILILVDELDRCRPTYAIEFLEAIKHFFDIKGLIFVLGVDKRQLAASARALFGHELDFDEYYRKFAHRNVRLPVKSEAGIKRFCAALVSEYLSKEAFEKKGRFSYAKQDNYRTENIADLCAAFSLNARQIHEVLRISAHVFSATKESKSHLLWGWHVSAFFMVTLCVKENDFYHRLGRREASVDELTEFLSQSPLFLDRGRSGFWWAALLYLSAFGPGLMTKFEGEFIRLGVWESSTSEEGAFQKELNRFGEAFGHFPGDSDNVISHIYRILEDLRAFADK